VPLRWSPQTKTNLWSPERIAAAIVAGEPRRRPAVHFRAVPPTAPAVWTPRKRAEMRWRSATRKARTLPDFLILSAGRCGSTSLFASLCEHPRVLPPSHKEPHFFDRNHAQGLDFYRRLFPLEAHRRARARRVGGPVLSGEATTYYLLHPAVPERAHAVIPEARLVVILRDPVDRAHSHYHLSLSRGREKLTFEEALDAEPERLAGAEERLLASPSADEPSHRFHSYVARGMYLEQLLRWERPYGAGRILFLRSEDFFADPVGSLRRVTDFLHLEPHPGPLPPAKNVASYDTMKPETRRRLQEIFAEPNRRLEEHLGRELGWQAPG